MQWDKILYHRTYLFFLLFLFIVSSMTALIAAGLTVTGQTARSIDSREVIAAAVTLPMQEGDLTIEVPVYRVGKKRIEKLPLEEYLIGVVAAEMPVEFPLEALKAQAIAARTYSIRRIVERDFSDVPAGAMIKDSVDHQAYLGEDELRRKWGSQYQRNWEKIRQAVLSTEGLVLTYDGKPITATFFSTSNGRTENAEEYWNESIPYLRSIPSPWDKKSPDYEGTRTIPIKEALQKLGVHRQADLIQVKIIKRTTGGQVAAIQIGGKIFSGREVRERLDLPSATFHWEVKGTSLIVHTVGYGHGVGMSQWGAKGMAEEGRSAAEILSYYYQGVSIQDYRSWIVS